MKIKINGQILQQSDILAVVLTMQIYEALSVVPNVCQKLDSVICIFSNIDNIFAY